MRLLILLLAFWNGFAIMTLEMLGGRMLAPWFGNSIHVWGSLITIFMLALSVGYLLGGGWSLSRPSLARFGLLFLLAGIMIAPLAWVSDAIMQLIFNHIEDVRAGALTAATALFFLPTVLMGMIGPYSVRLLVEDTAGSGHSAGLLFFVSTAGSALGTLMTSFYLVLWMEINTILYSISAGLLLASALAGVCRR